MIFGAIVYALIGACIGSWYYADMRGDLRWGFTNKHRHFERAFVSTFFILAWVPWAVCAGVHMVWDKWGTGKWRLRS